MKGRRERREGPPRRDDVASPALAGSPPALVPTCSSELRTVSTARLSSARRAQKSGRDARTEDQAVAVQGVDARGEPESPRRYDES